MFQSTIFGVAALCVATSAVAQVAPAPFSLPPLPYAAAALEPVIDAQTMTLHHDRHHQAYVDALNKAVAADPALKGQSLDALVAKAGTLPVAVRNNAGGHWNHSFFWKTMAPPAQAGQPSPALAAAIDRQFGSLAAFKAAFKEAGTKRFGSGWVWLVAKADGTLAITSTPNQDNPLMDVAEVKGTPILGNDVWEHAYYLKYQNRRADYLDGWWQVVDWKTVSDRYAVTLTR
ncbi:Fe-Mn family superoxide dismutase [Sphingobium wenxiniae]|uniref:Superoxide dismutase n=1 Tax=Sphingobium wenxiniae (strain DSM 21828 / CGMCC 1.7748 / JZ-1) TaxID=595605 RepID=A0A562K1R5_SPHWJ|nr:MULTISPECIES: superoxide dismutase [Sphingomonadaceae]MBB6193768.1 Fe-Mn family superoxide dismutase [Sphingobium wenxiniae]TWH89370.1 Fe-Mn family superoxide dismutase [Sphingobium wenxiniae]SCW95789.1 superoxide dismutase, Fe-Mn family [Sphingobium faniae]